MDLITRTDRRRLYCNRKQPCSILERCARSYWISLMARDHKTAEILAAGKRGPLIYGIFDICPPSSSWSSTAALFRGEAPTTAALNNNVRVQQVHAVINQLVRTVGQDCLNVSVLGRLGCYTTRYYSGCGEQVLTAFEGIVTFKTSESGKKTQRGQNQSSMHNRLTSFPRQGRYLATVRKREVQSTADLQAFVCSKFKQSRVIYLIQPWRAAWMNTGSPSHQSATSSKESIEMMAIQTQDTPRPH